ncbi:hypothetical protein [Candidatus Tisiphia endosymbiont of Myopa tessellatipennis]|uniref:hypothetical protein n=1 Tax=Candidatus Tisiphia endosymbiont of Myopa tessellatipennis TaxID=3066257 RepID=UPI00313CCE6E
MIAPSSILTVLSVIDHLFNSLMLPFKAFGVPQAKLARLIGLYPLITHPFWSTIIIAIIASPDVTFASKPLSVYFLFKAEKAFVTLIEPNTIW